MDTHTDNKQDEMKQKPAEKQTEVNSIDNAAKSTSDKIEVVNAK